MSPKSKNLNVQFHLPAPDKDVVLLSQELAYFLTGKLRQTCPRFESRQRVILIQSVGDRMSTLSRTKSVMFQNAAKIFGTIGVIRMNSKAGTKANSNANLVPQFNSLCVLLNRISCTEKLD